MLIGPVTWLSLGKAKDEGFDPLSLLSSVLTVYEDLIRQLAAAGADWV